ncbi:GNAT family N-acetyltransferase [Actinophytocola sp.]|uniref:GNAT family N-acetyltransferase n=1 Tax=Actinophytocola sp. TaxID=1872138 RepID=UPI002D80AA76|nr:GNAT family N-acetyltransferase [Actinophytocola sp.]HET9139910.1 GNAT family N-acetyltransferase [Actinophytocola sp.]
MAHAFVRLADPADSAEIARIQLSTWRTAYAEILPAGVLAGVTESAAAGQWRETIENGPATVLVAGEGDWTVGFGAAGPAPAGEAADAAGRPPEDAATVALVATLLVEPRWGRRGHGGRLLARLGQALRATGSTRGICWVPAADAASLSFYRRAGWAPDGTARTLDAGERTIREIRLTGSLDLELC